MHRTPLLLLSGFMGTGKSTIGWEVARRAGVPFIDLDDIVAERAGLSVAALFAERGEAAFRALERETLDHVLESHPTTAVVALGGGSLLEVGVRRRALERAFVTTLHARADTIETRTTGSSRPLLEGTPNRRARIQELLEQRAHAYAEAHAHVVTDERSQVEVAEAVLSAWAERRHAVPMGARSYVIRFGSVATLAPAALMELEPSARFVVTDTNVDALWGTSLQESLMRGGLTPAATVVLTPGEPHKRLSAVETALTAMVEAGADRDAVVLGHGGGVVTDIAGFVAATLLRGVRWIAVPTTLLAMVDASVGGKTGVDLGPAKNAVGAFHQPSAVIIDVAHVKTETERAFRSGLAEAVKTGCIGDRALFERMEAQAPALLARDLTIVEEVVVASVALKAAIVVRDEREAGDRALLNFGHTLGHALEAEGGFERLTHGEAIALGMVAMLRVGEAMGVTDAAEARRVVALLDALGLPTDLSLQPLRASLCFLQFDKKRRGGAIRTVLLRRIGEAFVKPILLDELEAALEACATR